MKEIEVKILDIDKGEVIKKLEGLEADKVFEDRVVALYFDFDDGSLSDTDEILRLRRKGNDVELAFKRKISKEKAKVMDELETRIDDFDAMKQILKRLGLHVQNRMEKYRMSYVLDDVEFELDTFPNVPTFMEIEGPSLNRVKEFVEKLGFSMNDAKSWTGKDVLEYYGQN